MLVQEDQKQELKLEPSASEQRRFRARVLLDPDIRHPNHPQRVCRGVQSKRHHHHQNSQRGQCNHKTRQEEGRNTRSLILFIFNCSSIENYRRRLFLLLPFPFFLKSSSPGMNGPVLGPMMTHLTKSAKKMMIMTTIPAVRILLYCFV